jgi:hypothetical protein
MIMFDFSIDILVKTSVKLSPLFGWLIHTTPKYGLNVTFFFAWVKQKDVLVISSLMYILHIWSMFGIFIAAIHGL